MSELTRQSSTRMTLKTHSEFKPYCHVAFGRYVQGRPVCTSRFKPSCLLCIAEWEKAKKANDWR